jgi:hypothetical protein
MLSKIKDSFRFGQLVQCFLLILLYDARCGYTFAISESERFGVEIKGEACWGRF